MVLAGCGDGSGEVSNKPRDAVSGFYLALLGDAHYFDQACRHTSPRFHVREGAVPGAPPEQPGAPLKRDGLCPEVVESWHARYGHLVDAGTFSVDGVDVNGSSASARTPLGRAGLEVVDGEWRVLWVEG